MTFGVAPNSTTSSRVGSFTIAGQTVTVTQSGGVTFNPASQSNVPVNPTQSYTVNVTAPAGTTWSATTDSAWITILSGGTFTSQSGGPQTLTYSVGSNAGGAARSGNIIIGAMNFPISQLLDPTGSLTITPSAPSLFAGQQQQFTAVFQGTTVTNSVTWSASGGGGTINSSGLYTAPSFVSYANPPDTITATYVSGTTYSALATVTLITNPNALALSFDPNFGITYYSTGDILTLPAATLIQDNEYAPLTILLTTNQPSGSSMPSGVNSCYIEWNLNNDGGGDSGEVSLANDGATSWTTGQLNQSGHGTQTLSNDYCKLDLTKFSVTWPGAGYSPLLYMSVMFLAPLNGSSVNLYVTAAGSTSPGFSGNFELASYSLQGYLPPSVGLVTPTSGSTVTGTTTLKGYAVDNINRDETAISSVQVFVDSVLAGNATLNVAPPTGSPACIANLPQPGCPNIGFSYSWNTVGLTNGTHTVRVLATDSDPGTPHTTYVDTPFTVSNPVAVTMTPTTTTLNINQSVTLSAAVTGSTNTAVNWSMSPSVGTLSSGVYTAPASIATQQTVTVTATSVADSTKSASATITLTPVSASLSPASASLSINQTQQFTATATGATNQGFNWTLTPAVGSLTSLTTTTGANTYTAPSAITSQQTVTLKATSVVDSTQSASITITLTPVAISVAPASVALIPGQSSQLTPTVTGSSNSSVTWTLVPNFGSITAGGLYTAPATVIGLQTIQATATSQADPSKTAVATITIGTFLSSPSAISLRAGQSTQFQALYGGSAISASWSINPSVGSISSAGLYTPPSLVASSQTVTVTATDASSHTATSTITLVPIAVTVAPSSVAIGPNQTQQFSATLTGTTNTSVTWSISPSVGSITAAGAYTAPASISGQQSITVTATSVADGTKSATATLTLNPISVTIGPVAITLLANQTQQFSASVFFDATNSGVTWSINPSVGSISSVGLYTAPATITGQQTVTVTATSVADPTKSASAIVSLGWYSTSWNTRKPITINSAQVSGTSSLTNFPMLFSVTDPTLKTVANGGDVGESNGNDILFTAGDGLTKLNHEIEYYNPSTGQVIAWVQIPSLSNTANTVIYIYYGNPMAANQQNPTAVWDSNYKGVWHLPNGTTLSPNDSTSNGNNGTIDGSVPATSGEIDGAASFSNHSARYIDMGANTNLEELGPYTVSAWVNGSTFTQNGLLQAILGRQNGSDNNREYLFFVYGNGTNASFELQRSNGGDSFPTVSSSYSYTNNTWYYVAGTFDGTTLRMYVNGNADGTLNTNSTIPSSATRHATIGRILGTGGNNYPFNGTIDEVRISNTNRSAAWIATEYNNQSSPGTFATLGATQGFVAAPTFNPTPGAYVGAQTVTIGTTTPGASIRYTTDGSTPTETYGTLYGGGFVVSGTTTINAIAYASGFTDSPISSATYTIAVAAPTFSPAAGNYSSAQNITISSATSGASIRYTTDGSTPSETAGTLYSGPVNVSSNLTLKAIAYQSGLADSSVSSAAYTFGWYNSAWTSRNSVTINYPKVSGSSNLTNFPMLFSVTNASFKTVANGGSVGESNGYDILFTAGDGMTKLNHELEYYNPSTGQVIAWVQIPSLSPTANTLIYIYYGNPSASNQQNVNAVWDSNYKGVWHLPNGTTLTAGDSTSNANNGTNSGATAAAGEIDGAASFSSADISAGTPSSLANLPSAGFTVEAWINPSSFGGSSQGHIVDKLSSSASGWSAFVDNSNISSSISLTANFSSTDAVFSAAANSIGTSRWQHVVITYNGSSTSNTPLFYVNGAPVSTVVDSAPVGSYVSDTGDAFLIGANASKSRAFAGAIDEVRVSNTMRSAAWIATEYNNQSSPSTFFMLGGP